MIIRNKDMFQFHFKHIKSVRNLLQNVGLYFLSKTAFLAKCGFWQQSDEHVINILNQFINDFCIRSLKQVHWLHIESKCEI